MRTDKKDEIFKGPKDKIESFQFNSAVADVFDDMVNRSIPFYQEIHRMILDICSRMPSLANNQTLTIVDLGCSTGTTLELIGTYLQQIKRPFKLVGVDLSSAMLEQAKKKLSVNNLEHTTFHCSPIEDFAIPPCDLIIMNYTLQFIPVRNRKKIVKNISESLKDNGQFILSEKIHTDDPLFEELFIDLYYDFKKRNGYSSLEISQKREALENVLIPLTSREIQSLLSECGFSNNEMLFRWYNFASFLGTR